LIVTVLGRLLVRTLAVILICSTTDTCGEAVAENLKLFPPAAILAEAGTGRSGELLDRLAISPPDGAAADREPLQVVV